jgi:putative ABC transport system permease protein
MLAAALRIVRADLRARPLISVLTGLVVAFALGALVVTLHGRATLDDPYDRLFAETNGAHVIAVSDSNADLSRIAGLPGVVASEGPRPLVEVTARVRGRPMGSG